MSPSVHFLRVIFVTLSFTFLVTKSPTGTDDDKT